MKPKISVILPTYNERENIGRLVEGIFRSLKDSLQITLREGRMLEIHVSESSLVDCSTDQVV